MKLKQVDLRSLPLNTDSYKSSMFLQYPPGTEIVYSYIESRGGEFDRVMHIGVQSFLDYLAEGITVEQVEFAKKFWEAHGEPFPYEGWMYIARELEGRIPVKIRSMREGLVVPTRNVLVTIENTDPKVPWITTWIETALLRAVWYPSTVGTTSWQIKQILKDYAEKTGDPTGLAFKLHDFGARGVSSQESAELGGFAHLINFMGTDTISGITHAMMHYGATIEEMIAFSIAASEHSTITSWTREMELSVDGPYANMIEKFAGEGKIFACVMDSFDILASTETVSSGEHLALLKKKGGLMVLRPDSDDPVVILPKMLRILEKNVGSTINEKGYRVLNNFRLIWGDGINRLTIGTILRTVCDVMGYSLDNFAFGMGGALLQAHNRDSQQYAMKCSAIKVNGQWVDVYKQPAGIVSKASKKGRVTTYKIGGEYVTGTVDNPPYDPTATGPLSGYPVGADELYDVFENGEILKRWTVQNLRDASNLPVVNNASSNHSKGIYAPLA